MTNIFNDNGHTYGVGGIPDGLPFNGINGNAGEQFSITIWNREEIPFSVPPGFSSPAPSRLGNALLYGVNILGIYNVASCSGVTLNPRDNGCLPTGGFDSGWWKIDLDGTVGGSGTGSHFKYLPDGNTKLTAFSFFDSFFYEYYGLPVIAIVSQEYINSNIGTGAFYGQFLPVFYEVNWIY